MRQLHVFSLGTRPTSRGVWSAPCDPVSRVSRSFSWPTVGAADA